MTLEAQFVRINSICFSIFLSGFILQSLFSIDGKLAISFSWDTYIKNGICLIIPLILVSNCIILECPLTWEHLVGQQFFLTKPQLSSEFMILVNELTTRDHLPHSSCIFLKTREFLERIQIVPGNKLLPVKEPIRYLDRIMYSNWKRSFYRNSNKIILICVIRTTVFSFVSNNIVAYRLENFSNIVFIMFTIRPALSVGIIFLDQ